MRYFYTILLLLLGYGGLQAQFCGKVVYTPADGIARPHNTTFIDSDGYLWVSSRGEGLNRFDGKKWKKFTTADGLGDNHSYPVFQDKEGGLWITHNYEKGASRYINGKFQHFPMNNGKVDSLKEGQSWFPFVTNYADLKYNTENHQIIAYQRDRLMISEFSYDTQSFQKAKPFLTDFVLNQNKHLNLFKRSWVYLSSWYGYDGIKTHEKEEDITTFISPTIGLKKINAQPYHFYPLIYDDNLVFLFEKEDKLYLSNSQSKELPLPNLKRYGSSFSDIPLNFERFGGKTVFSKKDSLFFSIWEIKDPTFENTYLLAEHNQKTLEINQTVLFQEDEKFDQFSKDDAGTYWYSTGNKVIRLFPNQLFIPSSFQGMSAQHWATAQDGTGKIWLSSYGNGLVTFDGFRISKTNVSNTQFINSSESDSKGNVYFTNNFGGITKISPSGSSTILNQEDVNYFISRNNDGGLISGTKNKGLWILPKSKDGISSDDWIKHGTEKGLGLQNVISALQDNKGRYWMGRATQGLAIYYPEQDTIYNWLKATKQSNYGIISMDEDHKGNLWLGTERGLVFFENRDSIPSDFDFEAELELIGLDYTGSSMVSVCKVYDEKTLIIGNSIGYFLIDLTSWYQNPRKLLIMSITASTGNQGGIVAQNGVWIDNNKDVWLACTNGAVRYTPNLLARDTIIPSIQMDSMVVDKESHVTFDKKIKLRSVDRTLRFHFSSDTISPYLYDNIAYRYKITGDTTWSALTKESYKDYLNLASGSYIFEVLAEKNGLRSKPVQVQFQIAPVWWQNPIFWLAVLGVGIVIALFLMKKNREIYVKEILIQKEKTNTEAIRREKETEIYEQNLQIEKSKVDMAVMAKEKDKLQVQAIVNQLNPHFINNALQWLQVRLDNNDDDEGVSVVGKLSQNISTVFKNSRNKQSYHSLPSEMKLAENYLYIQKMRFREKLNYQLPSKEELSKYEEVNIPLLNIQIHVENAVEHGIRNKKHGSGNVRVLLEDKGDFVKLIIEDDGVGREAAKVIGSKGTQNGTKMLKELESIFNKQNDYKLRQYFEDDIFTDTEGNSYGTRSIIEIPKQFNYEI